MFGQQTQGAIYSAGVAGARPRVPTAMRDLEAQAMQAMSPEAGGYIAGGAGREDTMHDNLAAFRAWKIVPRVLRDVEHRDTSTTVLGMTMPVPMLTAPIGVLEMAQSIREGRPVRIPGEIAFHVLDIMLSINEAMETKSWVEVKSTLAEVKPLPADWDPMVATLS